jgi:hypothetical protein
MTETVQPSTDQQSTLWAIAHDIVRKYASKDAEQEAKLTRKVFLLLYQGEAN